jgi:hypothetical protein
MSKNGQIYVTVTYKLTIIITHLQMNLHVRISKSSSTEHVL